MNLPVVTLFFGPTISAGPENFDFCSFASGEEFYPKKSSFNASISLRFLTRSVSKFLTILPLYMVTLPRESCFTGLIDFFLSELVRLLFGYPNIASYPGTYKPILLFSLSGPLRSVVPPPILNFFTLFLN